MYNPDIHHRRSLRFQGYDYSQDGAYFITICTQDRESLFGVLRDGVMALNAAGRMVEHVWEALSERFPQVALDAYVIMPNHFHGIIVITDALGAPLAAPGFDAHGLNKGAASSAPTLGKIMRIFKSISAIEANRVLNRQGQPLWQRNYYERVIRDEEELTAIREYIADNPAKWDEDKENPNFL